MPASSGKSRERLRREAADWFARLRAPDGAKDRSAFDVWYEADPAHAEAYDRLSGQWEAAGLLGRTTTGAARTLARSRTLGGPAGYALAAILVGAILLSLILLAVNRGQTPSATGPRQAQFVTGPGESRTLQLPDGSAMTLGADSRARVAYDERSRRITLLRGRARFSVAHRPLPFLVRAGDAQVTARGTLFDVAIASGRTTVVLIEGSVEVAFPDPRGSPAARVTRLRPGDRVTVANGPPAATASALGEAKHAGMLEFDETPLAEAVAAINRTGRARIRIDAPEVGRLRVTGAFRPGDVEGFARSLGAAFQLQLQRLPDGTFLLQPGRRSAASPKNSGG